MTMKNNIRSKELTVCQFSKPDILSWFIKKPGQKFESECLIMPHTNCEKN